MNNFIEIILMTVCLTVGIGGIMFGMIHFSHQNRLEIEQISFDRLDLYYERRLNDEQRIER